MARRYSGLGGDPHWYKDAIIYELHVKAFYDGAADGIGDLRGLIKKLDYLEDLGITAIWLLPFYPSPLKDDGYDISDYNNILPAYGTMADFKALIEEAHRRKIRIITELVINHTSDQHPWFQLARQARSNSRVRNFYVWSKTAAKYKEARIIFKDFENSNWTWDPRARAYYWHRFYSHQPDLNYDNRAVRREIIKIVDFWLKLGVDGLRVDAVPYLYEKEGTSCENLPETHVFLKELRAHVDNHFESRMLLGEANQWPEDAAAYFGSGDEFHMAFHFPIMPRLFMAIRMEDHFPIMDILRQTPAIPEPCQWATFLRNHDELTLEMVTDEERDYMYRVYASDPTARLNLGIRRRLAPLLNNDRKRIELMNILLFSLPGTPVIYYGDEIGMGDNIYLGDRNGVRTPMQWSSERNAGFSQANPQKLYLPPIIDPAYHYEAINVETQQNNVDSLFWWTKRLISLRKHHQAFGRGSLEFLHTDNHKVLAFVRKNHAETVLVIANLSRMPQQTQFDLAHYAGQHPVDLFGGIEFAPIGKEKYPFTLTPYAYYLLTLQPHVAAPPTIRALPTEEKTHIPTISIYAYELFKKEGQHILEPVLENYLKSRRWFRGKARHIQSSHVLDIIPTHDSVFNAYIALVNIEYTEGEAENYALPLITASAEQRNKILGSNPRAVLAHLKPSGMEDEILYDAMIDTDYCRFLLQSIGRRRRFKGKAGELLASPIHAFRSMSPNGSLRPAPVEGEQTNTSIVYGERFILKLFRRLDEGINPELELGSFLTERAGFSHISPLVGALEYHQPEARLMTLAVLEGFVVNEGDAWRYTLDSLQRYFQGVLAQPGTEAPSVPSRHILSLLHEIPPLARDTIGAYLPSAQLLGQRTAELHIALTSEPRDPSLTPEPFTSIYQMGLYQSMRSFTLRSFHLLREQMNTFPPEIRIKAERLLGLEKSIIDKYGLIRQPRLNAVRMRCHGDYHLGQVLYTGKDFIIIDFEGEPGRTLGERRLKRSPLKDVAGMIRSFHYAAYSALEKQLQVDASMQEEKARLQSWAKHWHTWVSVAFLAAYLERIRYEHLLPDYPEQLRILLEAHLIEKAVYELNYELNNRPAWLEIPIDGILQLIQP